MVLKHQFTGATNRQLANLCGSLDNHLKLISDMLNVKITYRQENFKIEGVKAVATRAMEVLQALFEMSHRSIDEETVQLMLAQNPEALPLKKVKGTQGAQQDVVYPDGSLPDEKMAIELHTRRPDLQARTTNQAHYLYNILNRDLTFGIGPAGTGKTFLAVACAVDALERSAVQRVILTRPAVEAGERLGFLPGDLTQKVDPYLRPLYDALYDLMGFERVGKAFERGAIEIAPLAFMRGRTLNHAFIILDEAQNTTVEQMKMFLTRIGFGSRAVVTGDISQIDLPRGIKSGLVDASQVLRDVKGIATTQFTSIDVVRHPLVAKIVEAYDAQQQKTEKEPFKKSSAK